MVCLGLQDREFRILGFLSEVERANGPVRLEDRREALRKQLEGVSQERGSGKSEIAGSLNSHCWIRHFRID